MEPKAIVLSVTLTKSDSAEIKAAATRMGLPVATWLRMMALAAARKVE